MSQRWHYSSKNAFKYLLAGALGSCLAAFMLFSYPELSGNSMENKGTRQQHLMANHSKVSEGAMVSPPNPIEPAERARPSELNDAPSDGSLAGKDQAASSLVDAETAGEGDDEGGRVGAVRPEVTSVHPFTAPAAGGSVITISGFSLCRSESISTLAYVGGRSCGALQCLAAGSLECVLPGGVGRALDVSVVTFYDAGGANTSTGSRPNTLFSYEDPALESIAPMQGRSTGGTHVTLTGSNFGPSTLELPPKVYFGNSTCLRPERLSDSTIVCATPPHSEGVAVVTIAVGPDDAPVMPGKGLRFVFVETPAERMLSLSAAAVAGLNLRPARQNGELPIVLHRGSVTHSAPEVQFVDPATNRSGAFLVPAHVIDDLPDEDLRKDFKSCAVVGESASLLDAGLAAEIDKHQAVIRLAHAPVSGYKQHVGKKTTIRVGDQSYLDALAALLADRSEPGIAKSEAAARSPLLAWGSGVFDRLHLCRSQGLPPSNLRLAAPWLQSTAQSVYAELLGRYESLGLRDAALEALGAPSDEARPVSWLGSRTLGRLSAPPETAKRSSSQAVRKAAPRRDQERLGMIPADLTATQKWATQIPTCLGSRVRPLEGDFPPSRCQGPSTRKAPAARGRRRPVDGPSTRTRASLRSLSHRQSSAPCCWPCSCAGAWTAMGCRPSRSSGSSGRRAGKPKAAALESASPCGRGCPLTTHTATMVFTTLTRRTRSFRSPPPPPPPHKGP
uniref:beta-galactoside alpha-(2,6)-sialyltransferase n=1 Tax=Tetraselmis sp. GSL018 TaxID=582737 RepID=A0A061SK47_9CHLO